MRRQIAIIEMEDNQVYSLRELCESACVSAELVMDMVDSGILAPAGGAPGNWGFACGQLLRLKRAVRLQRDLDLNLAGVALALDLLDDVDHLRQQVTVLERQLGRLVDAW